jgi:Aldo/keto reductase family
LLINLTSSAVHFEAAQFIGVEHAAIVKFGEML